MRLTNCSEMAPGPVFLILRRVTVNIPGDERSRTNPGHGYPARTEYYWNVETFLNKTDWEKTITSLAARPNHEPFKAIADTVATISTEVIVKID